MLSIHAMGAAFLQTPELALDNSESRPLAEAVKAVADFYPTTIDPKIIAWANLGAACGMIYGPRIFAIRARHQAEAAERRKSAPATASKSGAVFDPMNPAGSFAVSQS